MFYGYQPNRFPLGWPQRQRDDIAASCIRHDPASFASMREKLGVAADAVGEGDLPLLILATSLGRTECVEHLLSVCKTDANLATPSGETALMRLPADNERSGALVELLLKHGADVAAENSLGETPLMWAAYRGLPAAATRLLQSGASSATEDHAGDTAFDWAVAGGRVACMQVLATAGQAQVDRPNRRGRTPLQEAVAGAGDAAFRDVQVVETLLALGANAGAAGRDGVTPVMVAARRGLVDIIGVLARAGVNLNQQDDFGRTALMYAVINEQVQAVTALVKSGAVTNIADRNGQTASDFAVSANVKELLRRTPGSAAVDRTGKTQERGGAEGPATQSGMPVAEQKPATSESPSQTSRPSFRGERRWQQHQM